MSFNLVFDNSISLNVATALMSQDVLIIFKSSAFCYQGDIPNKAKLRLFPVPTVNHLLVKCEEICGHETKFTFLTHDLSRLLTIVSDDPGSVISLCKTSVIQQSSQRVIKSLYVQL